MASFDQTILASGGAGFIGTHTVAAADWRIILLRYFNPVGAHESGKFGEDPKGIPNNRMPYIQVAVGRLPELNVYGHDCPTKDGMWGLLPCCVFGTKSVK